MNEKTDNNIFLWKSLMKGKDKNYNYMLALVNNLTTENFCIYVANRNTLNKIVDYYNDNKKFYDIITVFDYNEDLRLQMDNLIKQEALVRRK